MTGPLTGLPRHGNAAARLDNRFVRCGGIAGGGDPAADGERTGGNPVAHTWGA